MDKKIVAYAANPENKQERFKLIIEQDKTVGYYIYVFDPSGKCVADYLQTTIDMARSFCKNKYNLDVSEWKNYEG